MLTKLSLDKDLQSAPQETVDQLVNLYNHVQFSTVIEQDTQESWDKVFSSIAEDILKMTKNWSS